MSYIGDNSVFETEPDPRQLGSKIRSLGLDNITCSTLTVNEITTAGGNNLVINPSGSVVDFSGKTLVNIGEIVLNPNYYQVIAPASVITTDNTPTTILAIPTVSNAVYNITASVSLANITNATSAGAVILTTMAKNISGTVSTISKVTDDRALDAGLSTIDVNFNVSGTDIIVVATGIAGTTIKWFAAAQVTRQLF